MAKIKEFLKNYYLFVLITLLAFVLRVYRVENVPPSLNWDEVSHGFNAYSILKTGYDEWGITFPTIFKAYGDYKLPVYIYSVVISIFAFGLNAFAIRLPSVLAGTGLVVITYLFVSEFLRYELVNFRSVKLTGIKLDEKKIKFVALLSALLVAVEPWSFFLSRGGFEANLALFLFVAGMYFFFRSLRSAFYILHSIFFFGLTVWTYNSYRIVTPLMLVVAFFIFRQELLTRILRNKKILAAAFLTFVIFFIPMFIQLANNVGQARLERVTIIDEGAVGRIIELRNESPLPIKISNLLYNRPAFFVTRFTRNWVSHFNGNYLYYKGGDNHQLNVPSDGLLYPLNFLFLVLGIFYLLKKRTKITLLLLLWFFIAPIPSSLTRESPHVLRSITFLPLPMIFSALGISQTITILSDLRVKVHPNILMIGYLLLLILFAGKYLNIYFNIYPKTYSQAWQFGHKEAVSYLKENYENYDKIIFTKKYGEPHEFILMNWPWDPVKYVKDTKLNRFYQSNWYWVDGFDKFYFVNEWDIPEQEWEDFVLESGTVVQCQKAKAKCLLVTSYGKVPKTWSKLKTINFMDGSVAFEIYEN